MKQVIKSKTIEIIDVYPNNPNKIVKGLTKKAVEKREIEEALAHIYGYG